MRRVRLLSGRLRRFFRKKPRLTAALLAFAIAATLASRVSVAYFLANDDPGDGEVYAQLARNTLEQGVYSADKEAPFAPTFIRVPGYPLFLAGVYSIFGHDNNTAVRIVQAIFDTGTCVLVALIAGAWTEDEKRRWRSRYGGFVLAALCPFIVIYTATILTETLTTFFMAGMTLTATLAFKSQRVRQRFIWWLLTGVLAGAAVMLRPDAGLWAAGIGVTILISGLFLEPEASVRRRSVGVIWQGGALSIAFCLMLVPWTIRNYRLFGLFQPLSPTHAEMPGEFVPYGYQRWLRTWVDDAHYIEPTQWNLDQTTIDIDDLPPTAFDSKEERERVATLLDKYNDPDSSGDESENQTDETDDNSGSDPDEQSDDQSDDQPSDRGDKGNDDEERPGVMTPEIDAAFGEIAQQRVDRSPARYYIVLPARRSASLWFDSHSLYYPFGGQMSPVSEIDYDVHQEYWLPLFTILMWAFTALAIGGMVVLWRSSMLRWLILVLLMTLPRIIFFGTIENPEPRYVVELFVFTAILGGLFLARKRSRKKRPELSQDRLLSVDLFRGIAIAAMVLVNQPGSWNAVYAPLVHAEWNGATPTDWIFPFFLFIVGVSLPFSLARYSFAAGGRLKVHAKIIRRAAVLFLLGLALEAFPYYNIWTAAWFDPFTMRIMGVLQRIAICYLAAALIYLHLNWRTIVGLVGVILLGYWPALTEVSVPGCGVTSLSDQACNLVGYVDRMILGQAHIWSQSRVIDPEGLLSTIPALATTLLGVLAGIWLRAERNESEKGMRMFLMGVSMTALGWTWSWVLPLNKTLWTSSYVLYTGGLAVIVLSVCYWVVEIKGYRTWTWPFTVFGTNAIALYVGSTLMGKALDVVELAGPGTGTVTLKEKIFTLIFLPLASEVNASLLFAVSFVLVWLVLMWLLYRKRIFLKI
ncbi:MAG: glycosyltransferase family 39 protein [Acidobacteria bacterium]|nr:glycosyltransferase family 39 protein [Acidobacteriota bacterium]